MVKKIFGLVHREISSLHDAAYFLAFFTFLSQILGLFRDRLLTHHYGAGQMLDIYYASFKIPDFIFIAVGSFISVSIVIPFLQDKITAGHKQAKEFVDSLFSLFFVSVIGTCVLAFIFMPTLSRFLFAGIEGEALSQIVSFSRILLLSPILMGISNLFASITQVHKRFILFAMSPILYNLSILLGIIFLQPVFGMNGIMFSVIVGAFFHGAIQVPFVFRMKLVPDFVLPINFKAIKEVFVVALPRTLGLLVGSISLIGIVAIASTLPTGSIAIFNLAYNLQSVPLIMIGLSYSMAAFPLLSGLISKGEIKKFVETIIVATKHIVFLAMPVIALFVVLRAQIVRVVLGSGNFSWNDTRLTAACLAIFAISAVAQCLAMLFVRAYYAAGSTKKPLLINVFSSVLLVVLPLCLLWIFRVYPPIQHFFEYIFKIENIKGSEVIALPLGFALGSFVNIILFMFIFDREYKGLWKGVSKTIFQSLSGAVMIGFGSYIGLNIFDNLFDLSHLWGVFFQGLFAGIFGIIVGIVTLHILQSKELLEVGKTLKHKIWKTKDIVIEQSELK